MAEIHGSSNQEVEMGVAPISTILSNPLVKTLLPFTINSYSRGLRLSSKGREASTRKKTHKDPIELGAKVITGK